MIACVLKWAFRLATAVPSLSVIMSISRDETNQFVYPLLKIELNIFFSKKSRAMGKVRQQAREVFFVVFVFVFSDDAVRDRRIWKNYSGTWRG